MFLLLPKTQPLSTGAEQKRGDSFGGAEESSSIALPGKGGPQQANALKTVPLFLGNKKGSYNFRVEKSRALDKDQG